MAKKMGRPKKEFDQVEFEKLCAMQATEQEICDWFGTSDKTLCAWCKRTYGLTFSEVFRQKRSKGKISLRRAQFKLAEKDAKMAIWLGRQYLDQTDKIETVSKSEVTLDLSKMTDEQIRRLLDEKV